MPRLTRQERIKQAEALGWRVGWCTELTTALYYPGLNYDWIEVVTDGFWCHIRLCPDGGERTMWDSGATRVREMRFAPYLTRLVAGGVICQVPKPAPNHPANK